MREKILAWLFRQIVPRNRAVYEFNDAGNLALWLNLSDTEMAERAAESLGTTPGEAVRKSVALHHEMLVKERSGMKFGFVDHRGAFHDFPVKTRNP